MVTCLKDSADTRTDRRGSIDILPSGSLRVRVYAGIAPDTERPRYLSETIPSGPTAELEAEQARLRLITAVEQQRGLRLNATLDELIQRHIALMPAATTTKTNYRGHHNNHIGPLIGHHSIGTVTAETLDEFYSELAMPQPLHTALHNGYTSQTARVPTVVPRIHPQDPLPHHRGLPIRHTPALDHQQPCRPGQSTP